MKNFALISEGITDTAVVEAILFKHYETNDLDINQIQPKRDATDTARLATGSFGGWERVIEYCGFEAELHEIFSFNDFLVIQIDTDAGDHVNYGLSLTIGGEDRSVNELVEAACALLQSKIGPVIWAKYNSRIFFAIAVHSTECWLLPIYETSSGKRKKTKACHAQLQKVLGVRSVSLKKDYRSYQSICSPLGRKGALAECRKHQVSLDIFLQSLPTI